ncbi:MAG: flagellar biosynthesis regulator FlaF [Hyphomonas sp.]|nr:flagellar biosynthesis regulator FlaF [Hyphomonas sp.]
MQSLAYKAYGDITKRTASDKQLEQALFLQITEALESAAEAGRKDFLGWTDAIHRNLELWTILTTDLLSPDNALPHELKGNLLSIANFVRRHTLSVLSGGGELDDLIEINRNILGIPAAAGKPAMEGEAA